MGNHRRKKHTFSGHNPTKHHRYPRSLGGGMHNGNISIVPECEHRAFHVLFEVNPPEIIARILNNKWIPLNKKLICINTSDYNEAIKVLQERRIL